MQTLNNLYQRSSYHVHEMQHPAPSDEQLRAILQAAMSTPDHGHLTPWNFLVIENAQVASLVELLKQAWLEHDDHVTEAHANRLASYLSAAPVMVLVSAEVKPHREISQQDQILSAAAACQMLLLAADQLGFGGVWYSTDAVELPNARQALGLEQNHHPVGFLIFGTPVEARIKKRRSVDSLVKQWVGEKQVAEWRSGKTVEVES
ncbi:nitroreductase [Vibrio sp. SCSIO 43136]|uniref:nitroreductase family protein n=1 Tax=Vibrio sp. SCSIO 43136 TaxID=2819101 RepID=UPI002075F8C1|nr:nitroreductase [Vibrio sp. SCSIO 43136]USD67622.1 nitroreductase [Vibrio sp. SCSIO 43136]